MTNDLTIEITTPTAIFDRNLNTSRWKNRIKIRRAVGGAFWFDCKGWCWILAPRQWKKTRQTYVVSCFYSIGQISKCTTRLDAPILLLKTTFLQYSLRKAVISRRYHGPCSPSIIARQAASISAKLIANEKIIVRFLRLTHPARKTSL